MIPPLEVRSKSHAYHVHLGCGLLKRIGALLRVERFAVKARRCVVITDEVVAARYAETVVQSLRQGGFDPVLAIVPAGERSKSLEEVGRVTGLLAAAGLDRHAFVVALGGGVVGDLAGFIASIYYRGIPFVQVPTTVVAQVDSSIGGKTGVNIPAGKNLLGAFHPPALVLADVETLATLPEREFNEGMAEAIKHAVIRDRPLLDRLMTLNRHEVEALGTVIRRNLEIKARIVARDEFERGGERALLNFGHTVGHAIEQAAGYGRFMHGEAISLGMVAAARLSMRKAGLPVEDYRILLEALRRYRLPIKLPDGFSTESILESMAKDKKFEAGLIRFVLTPQLGDAYVSKPDEVTWEDLREQVEDLRQSP